MQYSRIGVFLSAKANLPEAYVEAARQVGDLIGRTGRTLVYGGSDKGLMQVVAQHTKQSGGRVYGMIPDIIRERGWVSEYVDVAFHCADLTDRKESMNRESEVLIALPGGIGTLDEVFTVLANNAIGIRRQPVIFFNVAGCWDSLLHALDDLFAQGLISGEKSKLYAVATTIEELEQML